MPSWTPQTQQEQDPEEQMRKFRTADPMFWILVTATILTIVISIILFALSIWPNVLPFRVPWQ